MLGPGLNFFYQELGISKDAWKIFYDFQPSGSVIPSLSGAQFLYSGIPSMPTTGVFSGQNISISNSNELNSDDWTMAFVFEKFNNQDQILFSNYHGPLNSGFAVGVNSANHLYVETYSNEGPKLYETNIDLATRNATFISKSNNNLEFGCFDFNSKTIDSNTFLLDANSFLPSDRWYLGAAINPPSYFSGNPLRGRMELFTYITGHIFPYQKIALFSGLTLSTAPEYYLGLLDENCTYSYLGLTGNISDVTFNVIENQIYHVQTGYLINRTGQLFGNVTGLVLPDFDTLATGYLSGYLIQPSGHLISTTGFVSGFSGYSTVARGLRVFKNIIPSGVNSYDISFPISFNSPPTIFTELQDNFSLLDYNISGVSESGFTVLFGNDVPSTGYILTTTAAPTQLDTDFKFFETEIPANVSNFYVNFSNYNISNPKLFCEMVSNSERIFSYGISDISNTQFKLNLSSPVGSPGAVLQTLVTNLDNDPSFKVFSTSLNSGINHQFISFNSPFSSIPIVLGEIVNNSGEDIVTHQISGLTISGFHVALSNNLESNNYKFNTLAWSGSQSNVGYVYSSGEILTGLGQIPDESENTYSMSGSIASIISTQYDSPLYRSVYATGVTGSSYIETVYNTVPVFIPVGFLFSSVGSETGFFNHNIEYKNDGNNIIITNHTLYYSGRNVQPDPFTVYKMCFQLFGNVLKPFDYNLNYIYSFGMDGVHYLGEVGNEDYSELYVFPISHNKINLDIDAMFDRSSNDFFTYKDYSNGGLNVYLNGLGLLGGGYQSTGNIYNQQTVLDFDYTISGNYLFGNGFFQGEDKLVFDAIPGFRNFRNVPQSCLMISGMIYLPNFHASGYGYYFDGVKLVSGYDYVTQGANIKFLDSYDQIHGGSGLFFSLPEEKDFFVKYTGKFNYQPTNRFAKKTSMLWANGIRQNLDEQYLEISNIGLLTGERNFFNNSSNIFNNEGMFWG